MDQDFRSFNTSGEMSSVRAGEICASRGKKFPPCVPMTC
jgi:hypothetical protein